MSALTLGLFKDSRLAGEAVGSLKNKGYTDHVSLVAKDSGGDIETYTVKEERAKGAVVGAAVGGPLGALAGLVAGAVTAAVPGGLLLVAGPLAVTWGVSGAALGAVSGGLLGALVDLGLPREEAAAFEDHIARGDVLVAVTTDDEASNSVQQILTNLGATDVITLPSSS